MAYENQKQTVNDYERESINIADDTYNQLTSQMDKTLADIEAFLKSGKEDAATRSAFEIAEGNLQVKNLKDSVKTDTAKVMGSAGAGVRSGMAKDTLKKANREYDITSKKAKADIGAYKANAALNISSKKLDVYQNSATMKADAEAQAYEQTMNDRQFEYKKEQDAIDNELANKKLELDRQQFEFQKQKLENEKMAAAIGVATNLIKETTIENPETGEKETVQYYDFDQNGEMSAAERSLYVEDKNKEYYYVALRHISMATSVDEISQSLFKMQTDLFGEGINRVTEEIASWDNYGGFNEEYAKQLYMNFGLTDEEATSMMHEAKAMCWLNYYGSGEDGVVLGKKNEDGTYQNEQFYRDGLLSTGISEDRVNEYLDIMKKNWDTSLEFVNEIKNEIPKIEAQQQEVDKEIEKLIAELTEEAQKMFHDLEDEEIKLEEQIDWIKDNEPEKVGSQEFLELQNRLRDVAEKKEKYSNILVEARREEGNEPGEYIIELFDSDKLEDLVEEKQRLSISKTQYKDTYWFYTEGSQYGIIDKVVSEELGYEKLQELREQIEYIYERAPETISIMPQDEEYVSENGAAIYLGKYSSSINGGPNKVITDAVKSIFGEENLEENIVGYLEWCAILEQQKEIENTSLGDINIFAKGAIGLGTVLGRIVLSIPAMISNATEAAGDIWEENNQSLDDYTPNIKSFYQMADLKLQLIQEDATEAMYEINPVFGFIYSTGLSLVQNFATLGIAVAANFILPGAGSVVSAMLMSANSFNDTYNSVRMQGGSASQALTMGIISGAAEYVFEKLSIGKLLGTPAVKGAGKAFWKSLAKSTLVKMGFDAMDEMHTEIANIIGEVLVLDNLSEYEKQKQYYINEENKTEDVAAALAFRDQVGRVLLAGMQGAIVSGFTGDTVSNIKTARAEGRIGKTAKRSGDISALIKQGINSKSDSELHKIATQLNEKIKNKGKVSNQEVGALARAISSETRSATEGLSSVSDGISTTSKETALSNVSSGKVSVSDINMFMSGNEDARTYFKKQTGIELSKNSKTAFAQIVEYVASKTGKKASQVASELVNNAETPVDVTQKTIASLKSSGDETSVKVAEAFEFINSQDGIRMLEMQKNNQQPTDGTDVALYQKMLSAKQTIESNRDILEQNGYEVGTVEFNGVEVPVIVPQGYSDQARAEAAEYIKGNSVKAQSKNAAAQTDEDTSTRKNRNATEKSIKNDTAKSKGNPQNQGKKSSTSQRKTKKISQNTSKSAKTKSNKQINSEMKGAKKKTIVQKNGDTTVIREKEATSKNKAFKKAKQVSREETVGESSAHYYYTQVDTSKTNNSKTMDEIKAVKEVAKAAGAKNIVFISGESYLDGKRIPSQGFHSIRGTLFVNVDKPSLYTRTIGTEVYHQLRQASPVGLKAYENLVRTVIEKGKSYKSDFGQEVLSRKTLQESIKKYKKYNSKTIKDALFEEVCAEFAGEIITNPSVARSFAAADTKSGRTFVRIVKELLTKIQGKESLSTYRTRLTKVEKALVSGLRSKSFDVQGSSKKVKTKLSIQVDRAGNRYVNVTGNVLTGLEKKDVPRALSSIIQHKFYNLLSVNKKSMRTNEKMRNQWVRSKDIQELYKRKSLYIDKLQGHNTEELLKASKNWIGKQLKKLRRESFVEFARGTIDFKIMKRKYRADVMVGITKKQNAYLYDLINIKRKK